MIMGLDEWERHMDTNKHFDQSLNEQTQEPMENMKSTHSSSKTYGALVTGERILTHVCFNICVTLHKKFKKANVQTMYISGWILAAHLPKSGQASCTGMSSRNTQQALYTMEYHIPRPGECSEDFHS